MDFVLNVNRGFLYSVVLHLVVMLLLLCGVPTYDSDKHAIDYAMVVDVVPVASITNFRGTLKKQAERKNDIRHGKVEQPAQQQQQQKQDELVAPKVIPQPQVSDVHDIPVVHSADAEKVSESSTAKAEVLPTKSVVKKETLKRNVEEKKTEQAKEKNEEKRKNDKAIAKDDVKKVNIKTKKQQAQEWDRVIMKSLEAIKSTPKPDKLREKNKNVQKNTTADEVRTKHGDAANHDSSNDDIGDLVEGETNKEYNRDMPISISEQDAIRSQIERTWNQAYYGAGYLAHENAREMRVKVRISLAVDGTVLGVRAMSDAKMLHENPLYQKFVDSAIRAVYNASPIQHLPPESQYEVWHEMQFTFSSSGNIN